VNHDDLRYKGKIPNRVEIDGMRLWVPFVQEPTPEASWADVSSAFEGSPAHPENWPLPAHVAFANANLDDLEAFASFVRTYGLSGRFCNRDETTGKLFVDPEYARRIQDQFRGLWSLGGPESGLTGFGAGAGDLTIELAGGVVKIAVCDLDTFILFGYIIDRAAGRTHVCEYSRCPRQKYFLKARADQEFCSTQCRAAHNRLLWRSDPKKVEQENIQRRKAARKKRKTRP
jgi:hypothetical protein